MRVGGSILRIGVVDWKRGHIILWRALKEAESMESCPGLVLVQRIVLIEGGSALPLKIVDLSLTEYTKCVLISLSSGYSLISKTEHACKNDKACLCCTSR